MNHMARAHSNRTLSLILFSFSLFSSLSLPLFLLLPSLLFFDNFLERNFPEGEKRKKEKETEIKRERKKEKARKRKEERESKKEREGKIFSYSLPSSFSLIVIIHYVMIGFNEREKKVTQ